MKKERKNNSKEQKYINNILERERNNYILSKETSYRNIQTNTGCGQILNHSGTFLMGRIGQIPENDFCLDINFPTHHIPCYECSGNINDFHFANKEIYSKGEVMHKINNRKKVYDIRDDPPLSPFVNKNRSVNPNTRIAFNSSSVPHML